MNRRRALLGAGASALLPLPVLAQDGTVPEEWKERFAALEERITAIELRLDQLLGEEEPPTEQAVEEETPSGSADAIRFSGVGTTLTDTVSLEAGLYRVNAIVAMTNGVGDFFNVEVAGSDDWEDQIFSEMFFENGDHEVSSSWTSKQAGEYAFQIECMSSWELTFEAM